MQKIKGMKEVLSCPLILHVFNVILEKRTHFHFESNLQAMLDDCTKSQHASCLKKQNGARNNHGLFSGTIHWIMGNAHFLSATRYLCLYLSYPED